MRKLFVLLLLFVGCQPVPIQVKIWRIQAYNPQGKLMETCIYKDHYQPRASYWTYYSELKNGHGRLIKEYPANWFIKITEDKPAKAEVDTL